MSYVQTLRGLGAVDASFEDGIAAARSALTRLAVLGRALQVASTDPTQQGLADQVVRFATVAGPAGVSKAAANRDVAKLKDMQRSISSITRNEAQSELVDAVVERFLTFNILPAAISGALQEKVKGAVVPDLPGITVPLPTWAKVGIGFGALVAVAYVVRTFK